MSPSRTLPALALLGSLAATPTAQATCSTDPMVGSMCLVAFNFCPRGYLEANGALLPISQYMLLFALVGTTYGGNGQTNFALPDLRGRVPVGMGQGPGLSPVNLGDRAGSEAVTLTIGQLPAHSHGVTVRGSSAIGTTDSPAGAVPARLPRANNYASSGGDAMNPAMVSINTAGGSQPFSVRDPYLGVRYCIATEGIFPTRP